MEISVYVFSCALRKIKTSRCLLGVTFILAKFQHFKSTVENDACVKSHFQDDHSLKLHKLRPPYHEGSAMFLWMPAFC